MAERRRSWQVLQRRVLGVSCFLRAILPCVPLHRFSMARGPVRWLRQGSDGYTLALEPPGGPTPDLLQGSLPVQGRREEWGEHPRHIHSALHHARARGPVLLVERPYLEGVLEAQTQAEADCGTTCTLWPCEPAPGPVGPSHSRCKRTTRQAGGRRWRGRCWEHPTFPGERGSRPEAQGMHC